MKNIIKNMNLFVAGKGFAGKVTEVTPPKLALLMDEHKAGGMDAAVDIEMGMEKLEASFIIIDYNKDVLKLWGVADGSTIPFVFRGVCKSDDGTVTPIILNMRGKLKDIDRGTWKPAEKAPLTFNMSLEYYKETVGGEVIYEFDIPNMKRIVGGVDQLEAERKALGI